MDYGGGGGGAKGMLAPLSNYWGGGRQRVRWPPSQIIGPPFPYPPPLPTPMHHMLPGYPHLRYVPLCQVGIICQSGPGCSKLTTSLVNVSLNFQKLISQICQYFSLKKCEKLLHFLQCKSFSHFFNKKYQCFWL